MLEGEKLPARAAALGAAVKKRLLEIQAKFPKKVSYVFGEGLVWALLLSGDKPGEWDVELADRVTQACVNKGLLIIRTGVGSIKLGPPLTISEDALMEGVGVIEEALVECLAAAPRR